MSLRVAVASSDGITVNEHFGKANRFLIFEIKDDSIELIQERKAVQICGTNGHTEEKVDETVKLISDCKVVLVSRIGMGPELALQDKGIKVYEISMEINRALERFAKFV
jgi:nitrogen fixation protein NifX